MRKARRAHGQYGRDNSIGIYGTMMIRASNFNRSAKHQMMGVTAASILSIRKWTQGQLWLARTWNLQERRRHESLYTRESWWWVFLSFPSTRNGASGDELHRRWKLGWWFLLMTGSSKRGIVFRSQLIFSYLAKSIVHYRSLYCSVGVKKLRIISIFDDQYVAFSAISKFCCGVRKIETQVFSNKICLIEHISQPYARRLVAQKCLQKMVATKN